MSDINNPGQECNLLVGLLYGGYANAVVYGDVSGDNHWMGRPVLIRWNEHEEYDDEARQSVRWSFADPTITTPTYLRRTFPALSDYRSQEERTDTVRVLRADGGWEKLTRSEAVALVRTNGWPTNANHLIARATARRQYAKEIR